MMSLDWMLFMFKFSWSYITHITNSFGGGRYSFCLAWISFKGLFWSGGLQNNTRKSTKHIDANDRQCGNLLQSAFSQWTRHRLELEKEPLQKKSIHKKHTPLMFKVDSSLATLNNYISCLDLKDLSFLSFVSIFLILLFRKSFGVSHNIFSQITLICNLSCDLHRV